MRTTNFDAIITSAPLDRTASVVRDGSGEMWDAQARDQRWHWDVQPKLQKPCPIHEDLTGRVLDRFTVVGYFGKPNPKRMGVWVVRCSCGSYEGRSAKAIKNPGPSDIERGCARCEIQQRQTLAHRAAVRGRWPDGRPFHRVGLKTAGGERRLKDEASA